MGRVLQIRVSAATYRPEDVERVWPRLTVLAWPQGTENAGRVGVLELVEALSDQLRFGELSETLKQDLEEGVSRARSMKHQLEEALADWNPRRANELSEELEQALDEIEKSVHP
jgi:hypothetical protein